MDNEQSLTPLREAHVFDQKALSDYLADQLGEDYSKMNVLQFEGGQSNPTFMIENNGQKYVMRKKPPGKLLKSAHAVEREYRIMAALQDSGVPVPKTYLLCEDESIIGTPFYLMDCVQGRVLVDPELADVATSEERKILYDDALRVMAALHAVDYEAAGLGSFGRPGNYYARQISRWSKQYVASKTDDIEAMERLMEWLPANTPESDETTIVHGDFRMGNFIFHPTEPKISAVLDWELSTLGHPLADLAYFITFARRAHENGVHPDVPQEEEIVANYCKRTGRGEIENWDFYMAFTMFRTAGISQGVYKRGLDGNASSQHWQQAGAAVPINAERAWALVNK